MALTEEQKRDYGWKAEDGLTKLRNHEEFYCNLSDEEKQTWEQANNNIIRLLKKHNFLPF